jgi:hypothetical protein
LKVGPITLRLIILAGVALALANPLPANAGDWWYISTMFPACTLADMSEPTPDAQVDYYRHEGFQVDWRAKSGAGAVLNITGHGVWFVNRWFETESACRDMDKELKDLDAIGRVLELSAGP